MDRLNQLASSCYSPTKSKPTGKNGKSTIKFIAPNDERHVEPITLTVAHFLDAYSKVSFIIMIKNYRSKILTNIG